MSKLIVALIAGAFATAAVAQTTMPGETPKDKAKQSTVEQATQKGAEGVDVGSKAQAAGAAEAKKGKGTPKELTTTKEKQQAVSGTTSKEAEGVASGGAAAGKQADKDKKEKAPKAEKPDFKSPATQKEEQKKATP